MNFKAVCSINLSLKFSSDDGQRKNPLKFERETERLCVWLQMLCLFEFSKILSMNEIRSVKMQKQ